MELEIHRTTYQGSQLEEITIIGNHGNYLGLLSIYEDNLLYNRPNGLDMPLDGTTRREGLQEIARYLIDSDYAQYI